MNSLGRECNELKGKYDACFNVWFSEKFLKGDSNEDMCKPLFLVYRDCVRVSLSTIKTFLNYFLNIYLFNTSNTVETVITLDQTKNDNNNL